MLQFSISYLGYTDECEECLHYFSFFIDMAWPLPSLCFFCPVIAQAQASPVPVPSVPSQAIVHRWMAGEKRIIYIYIYVCVRYIYLYIYIKLYIYTLYIYIRIYLYIYSHVFMYIYIHVSQIMYIYIFVYVYIYLYIFIYVYIF